MNCGYEDVYEVIGRYCPKMLPYYADGWCRWPVGQDAQTIMQAMEAEAAFWQARKPETYRLIMQSVEAIKSHL